MGGGVGVGGAPLPHLGHGGGLAHGAAEAKEGVQAGGEGIEALEQAGVVSPRLLRRRTTLPHAQPSRACLASGGCELGDGAAHPRTDARGDTLQGRLGINRNAARRACRGAPLSRTTSWLSAPIEERAALASIPRGAVEDRAAQNARANPSTPCRGCGPWFLGFRLGWTLAGPHVPLTHHPLTYVAS